MNKLLSFSEKRLIFKDGPEGGFFDRVAKMATAAKAEVSAKEVAARGKGAVDKMAELEARALSALAEKTGLKLSSEPDLGGSVNNIYEGADGKPVFNLHRYADGQYMFVKITENGKVWRGLFDTKSASITDLIDKHLDRVFVDERKDVAAAKELAQLNGTACDVEHVPPMIVHYNFRQGGEVAFHITCDTAKRKYYLVEPVGGGEKLVGKPADSMREIVSQNFKDGVMVKKS